MLGVAASSRAPAQRPARPAKQWEMLMSPTNSLHACMVSRYNAPPTTCAQEGVMAKGQMRSTKEKKKPKAEHNKKKKGGPVPSPFAAAQGQLKSAPGKKG